MEPKQSPKLTRREFLAGTGAALLSTALFTYSFPIGVSAKETSGNVKASAGASTQYPTQTFDPVWQKTVNGVIESSVVLGTALPADDPSFGGWTNVVWTGDNIGISGKSISNYAPGDTWLRWINDGEVRKEHTDRWLKASIEIPGNWHVTSAKMAYKYNSSYFPINDDLYVFVDGIYSAGGGTAGDFDLVLGAIQDATQSNVTPPNPSGGTFVTAKFNDNVSAETQWYLDGGLTLPPAVFTPGTHNILILGEEFDLYGGIGHPVFILEYYFENRITGSGKITDNSGTEWDVSGNVGYNSDGTIVGTITIQRGKTQYQCKDNFSSLVFSNNPAYTPSAIYDSGAYTGKFVDKNKNEVTFTVAIQDLSESGNLDTMSIFDGNGVNLVGGTCSKANFQIHDGFYKG
jgi:hypothetical protein